jgi:magnesium chelatase subunit D
MLSYRRAPQPGHLLVLLLDHTCRAEDWNWLEPLSEYLGWAYVNRALVGVVEVEEVVSEDEELVSEEA